jgi:EmrB/QacA subfamily drug resistance transporter
VTAVERRQKLRPNSMVVPLIVACALFMQNLDTTIVNTALPSIAESFGENPVRLSLAITSYMLSLAVFIPVSGWVADRYGAKSVFRAAIAVFTLASILCGICDNLVELTACRVLQGIGGAMMVPVGRLVLLRNIDRADLVRAISYLTTPAILGPILGPPLGGLITTYFSWRWVFLLNVPVGVLGIVLVTILIEDKRVEAPPPLDWPGFVLTGVSLSCIMYGFDLIAHPIEGGAFTLVLLGIGLALGFFAVRHARRRKQPLIDLSLLRIPTFAVSVVGGGFFRLTAGAMPFLLPLMLQVGFGMSAFAAGAITFASGVGSFFNKMSTGPVLRRFGYRTVFIVNALIAAAFIGLCAIFTPATPVTIMLGILLLGGFFRSLQFTALNSLAFAEITAPQMSAATSLSSMMQQLTNGMGVALAAIALQAAAMWRAGTGTLATPDFHAALLLLALLSAMSVFSFRQLAPTAGADVTGHRPRAAPTAEESVAD